MAMQRELFVVEYDEGSPRYSAWLPTSVIMDSRIKADAFVAKQEEKCWRVVRYIPEN
jgi:hypothetical protein